MRRLIITLIIILTLVLQPGYNQVNFASANTKEITELNSKISNHKKKIKQLEDSISTYKNNIKVKQLEAVSLRNQLSIIDNHTSRLQADIELTDEKIKKTKLEIESLEIEIEQKESVIGKQKELISKLLRNINKNQSKNYLEILLTNKSLSEFYDQVQNLQTVYQDLGRTTKGFRLAKEDLEDRKKDNEKYKKEQQGLKTKLSGQRLQYKNQSDYKTNLLVQTKSSEWLYQTMLSNLKKQYQQVENEIRSYEREVQKKLAQQNKIPQSSGDTSFGWPTTSKYITAYFHDPEYPYRNVFEHNAIDIGVGQGSPLYAASSGYVARARKCYVSSCYSYILLVHTGNLSSLYGHVSKISVKPDQFVNKGDIVGYSGGMPGTVGAGPFTTGPHLHFEIRSSGIPVNPLNYIK
jgi:murein DD-endopeptidase MepM/ murein hydrolase activator NlpD